jgi:hypothetical protein
VRFAVLFLSLATFVSAASAAPGQRPAIRLAAMSPFTVAGTHFIPGERVRVVVEARGPHVRTVTARPSGRFTAVFHGVSIPDCTGYLVFATGDRGSRARISLMPECPQPPAP